MTIAKSPYLSFRLTTLGLLFSTAAIAQLPGSLPKPATPTSITPGTSTPMASSAMTNTAVSITGAGAVTDSAVTQLDKAIATSNSGNKAAAVSALNAGIKAVEQQASSSKGDFGNKLMNQAGNLKKLIPGVQSGLVSGNILAKAVSLVKMALGANQISSLLGGGGSLLGEVGALTSGLSLLKGGLPALGGQSATIGGSLIDSALGSVSKLGSTSSTVAEPAVKQQLTNVLSFAKGIL